MAKDKPKKLRAPRLVRVTRILKLVSTIVFILFILYLATVAASFGLSALSIHQNSGPHNGTTGFNGTSAVTTWQQINVTNHGFYPLTIGSGLVVTNAAGIIVGYGSETSYTIPKGGSGQLIFEATISVAPGAPGQSLLTQSNTLEWGIWANVSTGQYFQVPFSIHLTQNHSWSAPFANASVTGAVEGNAANVTFTFDNDGSFPLAGTLQFTVVTPGGTSCGSGSMGVAADQGSPFDGMSSFATTCTSLTGDSFESTLASAGGPYPFSVELPTLTVEG